MSRVLFSQVWNSPTLTTWGSFAARGLGLVIILPFVLRSYTPAEVALWQVFVVLMSLQLLAEFGFGTTFARFFAYALGGATVPGTPQKTEPVDDPEPNWDLLARLAATVRQLYRWLAWFLGFALLVVGTAVLIRRIQFLEAFPNGTTKEEAWMAWMVVLVSTVVSFRGNGYAAFLQGTNHVALVRRWEALFGLGAILTSMCVIGLGGRLLLFISVNQIWVVLAAWRNYRLARKVLGGRFRSFPNPKLDREVFDAAWPPAWRAGVGVGMSMGLVQFSGLFVAQSRDSVAVAGYLLAVRLVQAICQVSAAPFYSKLPRLALLWAQQKQSELVALATRGMTLSFWIYVIPFMILGYFGPWILARIGSNTPFPDVRLWLLLGVACFVERYGAMHLQLYSLTNRIIWHIANGVAGVVFLVVAFCSFQWLGLLALPLGLLVANLGFYSWYSARHSYRAFPLRWPEFDVKTAGAPAVCLCACWLHLW